MDHISQIEKYIAHLDERIPLLLDSEDPTKNTSDILELRLTRDSLVRTYYSYRGILLPIRRVPAEILEEIFLLCLEEYPYRPDHHSAVAPMLLCQICSFWRSVALGLRRLWDDFGITLTDRPSIGIAMLAEVWFSRARALPLSISVRTESQFACAIPLMHIISSPCLALRRLDIALPPRLLKELFRWMGNPPPPLLTLEEISLGGVYGSDRGQIDLGGKAPRLLRVSLGPSFPNAVTGFQFSWLQLTHLHVYGMAYQTMCGILTRTKNLEHALLGVVYERGPTFQGLPSVLPKLHYLHVNAVGRPNATGMLFRHITLPALEVFKIKADPWYHIEFTTFLARSSPSNLSSLTLESTPFSCTFFVEILRACPRLENLDVAWTSLDVFRLLDYVDVNMKGEDQLIPRLRRFYFRQPVFSHPTTRIGFFHLLTSRCCWSDADAERLQKQGVVRLEYAFFGGGQRLLMLNHEEISLIENLIFHGLTFECYPEPRPCNAQALITTADEFL